MRIVFFGTGKFGLPTLKKLLNSDHEIAAVVTQPDRKKGRGWGVHPTPVKAFVEQGAPATEVFQPEKLSDPEFPAFLKEREVDVFVVVDYGKLLSKEVLDLPLKLCLNLHPSLLPKYRGAAPVNWAILNGEKETGNTVIKMVEKMDAGSIVAQEKVQIDESETSEGLSERLSRSGADLVLKALEMIEAGGASFALQDENAATFAPKLQKKQGLIEWEKSAEEIERKVRAMQPWPGAFTYIDGKMLKICKAKVVSDLECTEKPGCVCESKKFIVITGTGAIQVEEVQPEGKRVMKTAEFVRGHRLKEGTVLG